MSESDVSKNHAMKMTWCRIDRCTAFRRLPCRPSVLLALLLVASAMLASSCGDDDVPDGDATTGDQDDRGVDPPDTTSDPSLDPDAEADLAGDAQDASDSAADSETSPRVDLPDVDPDETVCPAAPPGLPEVTITQDELNGRFWVIEDVPYPPLVARDVTLYLPASYETETDRRYPVLYMHDGQNLYHDSSAAYGVAWEVDDVLDDLVADGLVEETIVVGIHNTPNRIPEYTPDADPDYPNAGLGDVYADALVAVVKPLVDSNFRTLCGRHNTALAGSSLGGLISLHIAMRYPEVFGEIGCVSPSFWWNDNSLLDRFEDYDGLLPYRLWIDGGSGEGSRDNRGVSYVISDCRRARQIALDQGLTMGDSLGYLEDPLAAHNETSWSNRLRSILGYLLSDTSFDEVTPSALDLFLYSPAVAEGGRFQQTTLAVEGLHGPVRLTWPNELATLRSSNSAVATVAADGTVTGQSLGTATITAEFGGLNAQENIEVTENLDANIELRVHVPQDTPAGAVIHVCGSIPELGTWEDHIPMTPPDGTDYWSYSMVLRIGDQFLYKYTRGSWMTVEKDSEGDEMSDRSYQVTGDAVVEDTVATWADQ